MKLPFQPEPRREDDPPRPAAPIVIHDRRMWVLAEPVSTEDTGLESMTVVRPVVPSVVHQAGRRLNDKA